MIDKIKDILSKQLRMELDTIEDDANIMEDLGADSLDVVDMVMSIEEQFGISVPDADVGTLKTVRDVADYVERNM